MLLLVDQAKHGECGMQVGLNLCNVQIGLDLSLCSVQEDLDLTSLY